MKRTFLFLCAAAWLVRPATSFAHADFVIQAHGEGFADTTPVAPVGGNRAKTLGAQRLAAVKYVASIWSKLLDSPVPIVVDVTFGDLKCEKRMALAGASPAGFGGATLNGEKVLLPAALANRLAGEDIDPEGADIEATINTQVDLGCQAGVAGWYLGFDGKAGEREDLVDTLLHEFAHGLGFASFVDDETGELPRPTSSTGEKVSMVDIFTAYIVDVASGQPWSKLTAAQRLRSLTTPRGAVWDGDNVRALAGRYLTQGEPRVVFEPPIAGFSGLVGDGGAGARLSASGVSGPLFMMPAGHQCAAPAGVAGRVVVLEPSPCRLNQLATVLQGAGASAIILALPAAAGEAPVSFAEPTDWSLNIPLLTMANADSALLRAQPAGFPQRVRLFAETTRYAGADAQGRPYLYTNDPAEPGSTASHFETLARPDLLMEPAARARNTHDVDLTRALLADIGWEVTCGNGTIDPGELCDEGTANSDARDARCHTTCKPPTCGDGIVAAGEACDEGMFNGDADPGACGTTCQIVPCPAGTVARDGTCMPGSAETGSSKPGSGPFGRGRSDDDDDDDEDEDEDEDIEDVKGGDDGCRLASSATGQHGLGSALSCLGLLALVAVRRRRSRR